MKEPQGKAVKEPHGKAVEQAVRVGDTHQRRESPDLLEDAVPARLACATAPKVHTVRFYHSPHPTTSPDSVCTQCDVVLKFLSDIPTAQA